MNRRISFRNSYVAGLLFVAVSLSACVSDPVRPGTGYAPSLGEKAASTAESMIGRPYKYRGDSPEGFDCSGLVRYSYLSAGLEVPHGTTQLRGVTRPVGINDLRRGDLLFFNKNGKTSHVGIYLGGDLFVHAPSKGGKVRKESLTDPHWKKSFHEARRFS